MIIAILRGSKHLWKTLKRKKLKNIFRKGKERVNYVWWCQKGGEIKIKQKLKLDKKQNPKLWEKEGEIKQKQRLREIKTNIEEIKQILEKLDKNKDWKIKQNFEKFWYQNLVSDRTLTKSHPSKAKSWVQCK